MRSGFTLIELLVVIAIVAILSVVVILTLNPAELLRQSRDSTRLSDLGSITTALGIFATDQAGGSLGTASTSYMSVPDASATCGNTGLASLPSGWGYHCAPSSTLRTVNGSGWIPTNMTLLSSGAPIAQWPVDPVNATSSGLYYTFAASGNAYEVTGILESQKYGAKAATDQGSDPAMYEVGSNLALSPFVHGLVAYWPLDDGSGATAADRSGFGADGTWSGSGSPRYVAGKVGAYAGSFNGSDDWILTAYTTPIRTSDMTFAVWVKTSTNQHAGIIDKRVGGTGGYCQFGILQAGDGSGNSAGTQAAVNDYCPSKNFLGNTSIADGAWHYVVAVRQSGNDLLYIDGSVDAQSISAPNADLDRADPVVIGNPGDAGSPLAGYYFNGQIDDVRIYSRALTTAQVRAAYNAAR